MLTRHLMRQAQKLSNGLSRASYYQGGHIRQNTMNDLPVPAGDWYEMHARRNSKYNAILAIGALSLVGTIAYVKSSGIIHFNATIPDLD